MAKSNNIEASKIIATSPEKLMGNISQSDSNKGSKIIKILY